MELAAVEHQPLDQAPVVELAVIMLTDQHRHVDQEHLEDQAVAKEHQLQE